MVKTMKRKRTPAKAPSKGVTKKPLKKRRRTSKAPKVSPSVKAYVAKAVDASNPDIHLCMYVKPQPVLRSYNGTDVSGQFNNPPRTDTHFFLHRAAVADFNYGGFNIPEQLGLRHLENRSNLDGLSLGQLTGNGLKLKSLYIKGRYIVDQSLMERLSIPELHIRTMCLEEKEKSFEEIVGEYTNKLYADSTSAGEVNPKAGILYKMFRDPTGYTTQNREDQESSGYQWPNVSKLCRAFPDMYAKDLPLNTGAFKYLGGTSKKAKVADWKPVWVPTGFTTTDGQGGKSTSTYEPTSGAINAVSPHNGNYSIPFSFKVKHPSYLRWDNVHKRIQFGDVKTKGYTSGPQNYTPFLATFINSPNAGYTNRVGSDTETAIDRVIQIEYKIYATIDAKPAI